MSKSDPGRIMNRILLIAGCIAVIAVSLLFIPFGGQAFLSLVHNSDTAVSSLVLEEVKDAYRINTVEYLYRVVFPYDFMSPEVSEITVLRKLQAHFGVDAATFLDPRESVWLNAMLLAKKYGLNIKKPDYHFLVATVSLRAGFDLEDLAGKDWIVTGKNPQGQKTVRIALPKARILEARVEDPVREKYPFPDVPLSPEGWKELSALMKDHATALGLADGILDKSRRNAETFLEKLLLNSGFSEVSFVEE